MQVNSCRNILLGMMTVLVIGMTFAIPGTAASNTYVVILTKFDGDFQDVVIAYQEYQRWEFINGTSSTSENGEHVVYVFSGANYTDYLPEINASMVTIDSGNNSALRASFNDNSTQLPQLPQNLSEVLGIAPENFSMVNHLPNGNVLTWKGTEKGINLTTIIPWIFNQLPSRVTVSIDLRLTFENGTDVISNHSENVVKSVRMTTVNRELPGIVWSTEVAAGTDLKTRFSEYSVSYPSSYRHVFGKAGTVDVTLAVVFQETPNNYNNTGIVNVDVDNMKFLFYGDFENPVISDSGGNGNAQNRSTPLSHLGVITALLTMLMVRSLKFTRKSNGKGKDQNKVS